MNIDNLVRQMSARGAAAAEVAVAKLAAALVMVAEAELPGISVTRDDAGVQLLAPGLRTRALGTRRQPPDQRLRGMLSLFRSLQVPR